MGANLKNIVAEACEDPGKYPNLMLLYIHGHELSGMIRFQMTLDGNYVLTSNCPPGQDELRYTGKLDSKQRDAILSSIKTSQLFDIQSSTRIAADDEIPTVVQLTYKDLSHRLLVWEHDEPTNPNFARFEMDLQAVFSELSKGTINVTDI